MIRSTMIWLKTCWTPGVVVIKIMATVLLLSMLAPLAACGSKSPKDTDPAVVNNPVSNSLESGVVSGKELGNYFTESKAEIYKDGLPSQAKSLYWTDPVILDSFIVLISSVDFGPPPPNDDKNESIWNEYISQCGMITTLHLYSLEGELLTEMDLAPYLGENTDVVGLAKAPDDGLYLLNSPNYWLGNNANDSRDIYHISFNNQEIKSCQKLTTLETENDSIYGYMHSDDTGSIYVSSNDNLLMLDAKGNILHKLALKSKAWVNRTFAYKDQLYVDCTKYDEGSQKPPEYWIAKVDWDKEEFVPVLNQSGYDYNSVLGDIIYVKSLAGLSQLDLTTGAITPFMRWQDTNYFPEGAQSDGDRTWVISSDLIMIGTSTFNFIDPQGQIDCQVSFLHKQAQNPNVGKQIITISGRNLEQDKNMKWAINQFNQSQSDYMLRTVTMEEENQNEMDYDALVQRMVADFSAGNIADMMLIDSYEFPQYTQGDVLSDFNQLFADDKDFKGIDFLPNIIKLGESDGKLLGLPLAFGIRGIVMPQKILGDRHSWSLEDYNQLVAEYPDSSLLGQNSYGMMFSDLFPYSIDSFVDYEQQTADFSNQNFVDLLEFVKKYGVTEEVAEANSMIPPEPVTGNIYKSLQQLLSMSYQMSPSEFAALEIAYDQPLTIAGYPSTCGATPTISFSNMLLVKNGSPSEDGIKAFVKFLLSDEVQQKGLSYFGGTLSVRESILDKQLEDAIHPKEPVTWQWIGPYIPGKEGTDTVELTADGAKRFKAAIQSVSLSSPYDRGLYDIVYEEIQAYFLGDKTAQQVADVIQNRTQTLLNERG